MGSAENVVWSLTLTMLDEAVSSDRQNFTNVLTYVFFTAVSFLVHKINMNIDPFEKWEGKV